MQEIEGALLALREAIYNEIVGQQFYDEAARQCVDLWAKEVFANLAQEEEEHTRLLLLEYRSLETHGRWLDLETARASTIEVDITEFDFLDHPPDRVLFPQRSSVGEVIDRRADDLAALAIGIKMEQAAIDLYSLQAREVEEAAGRDAYRVLVQEEARHYEELSAQWERLAGAPFGG